MVASYSFLFFTLVVSAVNAFNLADVGKSSTRKVVPGRYIVEFDSGAHLTSSGIKRAATPHEYIYSQLKSRSLTSYIVHQEYASELFYGASFSFSVEADLSVLLNITGIIDLRPVHLITLPDPILSSNDSQWPIKLSLNTTRSGAQNSYTAQLSNTTTSCSGSGGKQTCTTQTITSSSTSKPTSSAAPFSNLPQIQADKVHASGNKGKGIKIGIIDGGVDYTREPLGGCFGPNCKIAGGYDFVGDQYNGSNNPTPDNDPFDNCYTHGTIVSGVIGANDNQYGVTGVAPEASLYVYRTFGCNGATTEDIVLAAMEMAYNEEMDIINLSIGESSGWTEGILSVYASRIVAKGTIVTVSAGNRGQVGAFYSQTPAAGKGVINTGSSDNSIYPAHLATVSTGHSSIPYYNFQPFNSSTLQLYTINSDTFGCTYPEDIPDLSPYVVIVQRGSCSLYQKAQNAYRAGATAIFVVNDGKSVPIYQNFPFIGFGLISQDDGNYLLGQINSTTNATVSFSWNPVAMPNVWTGNTTSYFSQIGPTNDLYFAPSLLAPGSNIISVVPASFNNWSIVDGTSWSSGFAAGAAALYLNVKGSNLSPIDVKSALGVTSQQLPISASDNSLASVAIQGAGRLQINDAINAGAVISPAEILLNDTAHFDGVHVLTITNPSRNWVKYNFEHEPARTALAFRTGLNQSNDQPLPHVANAASVNFWQQSLLLWPGQTFIATIQFTPPSRLDAKTFPIYSGFIKITGGSTVVRVPYMGVAAKMRDMPVLDPTDFYLGINTPAIVDVNGNVQEGTTTYTFSNGSYPSILYRLVGGTPSLLIDLIDASTNLTFVPDYTSHKRSVDEDELQDYPLTPRRIKVTDVSFTPTRTVFLQDLWCRLTNYLAPGCFATGNTFKKVPILGSLSNYEYLPRNTDNIDSQGEDYSTYEMTRAVYANGTSIPNGTYRFLLRALHITGDRTKESDYESWVSKPFVIAQ
ncbi:hypothetical protein L204_104006 [Cryptococcus depauperatus]